MPFEQRLRQGLSELGLGHAFSPQKRLFISFYRRKEDHRARGMPLALLGTSYAQLAEENIAILGVGTEQRPCGVLVMFGISISGIKNSQKHIDVTSNNIANTNSYGFKKSRAEFADVYANSVYTNSRVTTGMGVQNTVVSQQFAQGALSGDTGNPLDMAIQGNGFFVLSGPNGDQSHTYTRNGAFQVDNEGYIVTATGDYLQGWDVDDQGRTASLDLNATHNIQIPSDTGAPKQSNNITIGVNVPADSDPVKSYDAAKFTDPWGTTTNWPKVPDPNDPAGQATVPSLEYGVPRDNTGAVVDEENATYIQYFVDFDPNDSSTYTNSTSQTVHDSLGGAHTLTYYFINMGSKGPEGNDANTSVWTVIPYLDGAPVDVAQVTGEKGTVITVPETSNSPCKGANFFGFRLEFDSAGELVDDKTIPGNIQFVNGSTQGTEADLRTTLFGGHVYNEQDGSYTDITGSIQAFADGTVEDTTFDNVKVRGDNELANGTLHTAMGTGIDPDQILNLAMNATQYGSSNFDVSQSPTDDGYATGVLTSISVDENGVIVAEYTNGSIYNIAKVAMADFVNQQGLTKIGDTQWRESLSSGPAIASEANSGSTGSIKGSNLELSNVDLTTELVELITAQRNYQANAQSLQTQNTVMDSILNIR